MALKALSPGINDPETAVLSLQALTDLFAYKLYHFNQSIFEDENGIPRVQSFEWSFEKLFEECYYPTWKYGKTDRFIQNAMLQMIEQLMQIDTEANYSSLFNIFLNVINKQIAQSEFLSK